MADESVERAELELTTKRDGASALVAVAGELDAHTVPALEELARGLRAEGCTGLTLDLSETSFIDSAGLRTLVALHSEFGAEALALRSPSDPVTRLLDITGLTEHFTLS